jgi:hypothetical protein
MQQYCFCSSHELIITSWRFHDLIPHLKTQYLSFTILDIHPSPNNIISMAVPYLKLEIKQYGDFEPSSTCVAVFDLITALLNPSSSSTQPTPLSTAHAIDALYTKLTTEDPTTAPDPTTADPENFLWNLWDTFLDLACQVPSGHPSSPLLIHFIKSLASLPSDRIAAVWGTESRLWQDLPFLKQLALEEVNGINTEILPSDPNFDWERGRWVSFHQFAAQLTHLKLCKNSDFTSYTLYEFRDVLAVPPYPTPNPGGGPVEILDFRAPVAAAWILIAGKEVFENEEVTVEKWSFWQRRFREIGQMREVGEDTRKVALDAAGKMEMIADEARVRPDPNRGDHDHEPLSSFRCRRREAPDG